MRHCLGFCLLVLVGLTVNAQTINLRGVVSNATSQPIANAYVTLVGQKMKDTTGSDGKYSFAGAVAINASILVPKTEDITLHNGVLRFSLSNPAPVKVEIFDSKGILLKKEQVQDAQAGLYSLNIAENTHAANMLMIHASIGKREMTLRYLPFNNGKYRVNTSVESSLPVSGKLAKITAISDTLKVTASNYAAKAMAITSYDQSLNITLDTVVPGAVTVQLDQTHQTIEGFGLNTALGGGSFNWDNLFTTNGADGIGLSIVRVGMNPDGSLSGDVSGAKSRNVKIIGSVWTAPKEWKDNGNESKGGHLITSHYDEFATRIATFAKNQGLYAMGAANEPDFASCASMGPPCTVDYATMLYTANEMVNFVKVLGPKLKALNPPVKLIAPEPSEWIHLWSNTSATGSTAAGHPNSSDPLGCGCFGNTPTTTGCASKCSQGNGYDYGHYLYKDTAAWNKIDIIGTHEYDSERAEPWPADVNGGTRSKPIYETEVSGVHYWPEEGPSSDINNGVAVAGWIHSALVVGEASGWLWWWYKGDGTDNEGLVLSSNPKRYYTLGNYSKFVRPGYVMVSVAGNSNTNLLLSAFKGTDGTVVVVAVNKGSSSVTVPITIAGAATMPTSMTPTVTSSNANLISGTAVPVSGGIFTATLASMTVTTFVGK